MVKGESVQYQGHSICVGYDAEEDLYLAYIDGAPCAATMGKTKEFSLGAAKLRTRHYGVCILKGEKHV